MTNLRPDAAHPTPPADTLDAPDGLGTAVTSPEGVEVRGEPTWASLATSAGWVNGRIALIVAGLGLLGVALGGGWFAVDNAMHVSPPGLAGVGLVVVAAALIGVGLLLTLGGLGYYVFAPLFAGPSMAWIGVGSHRLVIATTLLVFLLANAGPLVYASIGGASGLRTIPAFLTAALSLDLVLIGITYLRFIRPGVLTAADLGLRSDRLLQHIGIGLLVGVGVLVASAMIQAVLQATGVRQTQLDDLQYIRQAPPLGFLAVVLAGGVLAPIAEELYFRGYVFRSYLQARGPVTAYGGTSLLFAMLHLNLPALLPILFLSLVFCFAYRRTGSIVPSVVGHALNNTAAFCILYLTNAPL